MDTDALSEMAYGIIVQAARISDTLKAELGALSGNYDKEDDWLRGVLLVALAFIDEYEQGKPSERFDDTESKYAPNEYFERAKTILAKRPELAQVGELIEKASDQMDQTHGSDS